MTARTPFLLAALATFPFLSACQDHPGVLPNADPALRRPTTYFSTDAASRAYPADAPQVKGIAARAQVGYVVHAIDVANLTDADWTNVEIWVNRQYVVALPVLQKGTLRRLEFRMLFTPAGQHLPDNSRTFHVDTVEAYFDGKLHDIPVRIPD